MLLKAEGLTKRYGNTVAVDSASLYLKEGEIVGVYGRSGAGKTTLLSMLCGLVKCDEGKLTIEGKSWENASETEWAQLRLSVMGFVFQNFLLDAQRTASQNVMMPLLLAGATIKESREMANIALEAVGLGEFTKRKAGALSGGQRQRVAFARAIANRPRLILADEPTGNLDAETAAELLGVIESLCSKFGTSCLMVTHDPLAEDSMHRAYRLVDGCLTEMERVEAPSSIVPRSQPH